MTRLLMPLTFKGVGIRIFEGVHQNSTNSVARCLILDQTEKAVLVKCMGGSNVLAAEAYRLGVSNSFVFWTPKAVTYIEPGGDCCLRIASRSFGASLRFSKENPDRLRSSLEFASQKYGEEYIMEPNWGKARRMYVDRTVSEKQRQKQKEKQERNLRQQIEAGVSSAVQPNLF